MMIEQLNLLRQREAWTLAVWVSACTAGCTPTYSQQDIIDPQHVSEVILWEGIAPARPERFAVVREEAAKTLVRCMSYRRQDNPLYKIPGLKLLGAVGTKPSAHAVIVRDDGTAMRVSFDHNRVNWPGELGELSPQFKNLYEALPWQNVATTRPAGASTTQAE